MVESGRALVWPIYKDTFERKSADFDATVGAGPAEYRDHVLLWSRDLRRTLDYLATRGDLAPSKTAYLGTSWGAGLAPVYLAVEPRFGAAILRAAGFGSSGALPEVEPLNYITRVKLPVLMLSDRYDNFFPVDSSQLPFFHLLGTPEKDKKRVVYESGHGGAPVNESVRESLDFLDRYLGPVRRSAAP